MRVLTAGIYAAIVLGSPASSQGYHASGIGTGSCEAFAKHRRENSNEEFIYFTWAQGYLSGLNTAQHLSGDRLRNLSAWTTDMQMAQILTQRD